MQKNIFIVLAITLSFIVGVLIVSKVIFPGNPRPAQEQKTEPVKIESASKEEGELFALASRCEKSEDLLTAHDTYKKIMEKFPASDNVQKAQEGLERANVAILFSTMPTPDSVMYEVQKGDTLARIAKKFSTTQAMILKANNLKDAKIVPLGRKLKVHNEKISIVVDRSQNILTLKSGNKIVKTYRVSTGVNNSTPVGTFKVVNKIVNPPWYTAGGVIPTDNPKNILGSRWLGLSAQSYGIHGTTEPQSIGKQITSGCVRMRNPEVEELYEIVPEGTEVTIVD